MTQQIQHDSLIPDFRKVQAGEDKLVVLYTTYRNSIRLHESYLALLERLKPTLQPVGYWGQSELEAENYGENDKGNSRRLSSVLGTHSRIRGDAQSQLVPVRLGGKVDRLAARQLLIQFKFVCRCVTPFPLDTGIITFCRDCHRVIEDGD